MSSVFDLAPTNQRYLEQQAERAPLAMGELPYRFSSDVKAPFIGAAAAINDVAMLGLDAVEPSFRQTIGKTLDQTLGTGTTVQDWSAGVRQASHDAARYLQPDETASWVGKNILFGLTETLPQFIGATALGGGNPLAGAVAVGGIQANKTMQLANDQGVDPGTAAMLGGVAGVSGVAGAFLPVKAPSIVASMFKGEVQNLTANLATGVSTNVMFGAANRAATSSLLEARGYHDMAQQYKALDGAGILADAVLGAAFSGYGHMMERPAKPSTPAPVRPTPEQTDAALTILNQKHTALDTMPGLPVDPKTAQVHRQAIDTAIEQMMHGDPVDVGSAVGLVKFEENPAATQARDHIADAVSMHLDLPTLEANMNGHLPRTPVTLDGAIMGRESFILMGDQYVPVRYAVVDAASHQATLQIGENQFRDRTSVSSEAQIAKIANNPKFSLLNEAPIMDFGAPTMNKEGLIIGGNGRFEGVSRAYDQGKGETYRAHMQSNLEQFGIRETAAAGMKKPVLVRVIEADVNTKQAALASNEGGGAKHGKLEQARIDADRFPDISNVRVGENGEILSGANHTLIYNWTRSLPVTEAGTLVDRAGRLSAGGMERFQNAILFKAFGASPTLERLIESKDPGARNVASALTKAAPEIAKAKAAMEKGESFPQLDLTADIMAAADKLNELRAAGTKVADFLNQGDMFGGSMSLEARKILEFFGNHMRSSKAMGEMIRDYWHQVEELGNPKQSDLMGEKTVPTKGEILDKAIAETQRVSPAVEAELPFSNQITEGVTPEQHAAIGVAAHDALQARVDTDYAALRQEYNQLAEAKGGRMVSGDVAKELSPEYMQDRTLAGHVHEAASNFAKKHYAEILSKPVPAGQEPEVLITGGGTGAGKSSGLHLMGQTVDQANAIYDTTLASFPSSKKKIDEALAAGRRVVIAFTYRDPVEAFKNGALPRAMSEGRTVPMEVHISSHLEARKTVGELASYYKDNPNVAFIGIDNSHGFGNAKIVPVDKLPVADHNAVRKGVEYELQQAYASGKISKAVYDATRPAESVRGSDAGTVPGKGAADGTGDRGQPQQNGVAEGQLTEQERLNTLLPAEQLDRLPEATREPLKDLYLKSFETKPIFDQIGSQIAQIVGGVYKPGPIKGGKRAISKILDDYNGDITKIKDLVRATIVVDTPQQATAALAELRNRMDVQQGGYRNLFEAGTDPVDGYRDAKVNIKINGQIVEMQISFPEIMAVKKQVHVLYEQRSEIERASAGRERTPEEQAKIDQLNASMKTAYDAAWDLTTKSLKAASETGAPLSRAETGSNTRGGDLSQAAQENLTPGTFPNETGMPSTSKNSTEGGNLGNSIAGSSEVNMGKQSGVVNNATPRDFFEAGNILTERPDLLIPNENGELVPAAQLYAAADAEIAIAKNDAPGYDAAAACALRG